MNAIRIEFSNIPYANFYYNHSRDYIFYKCIITNEIYVYSIRSNIWLTPKTIRKQPNSYICSTTYRSDNRYYSQAELLEFINTRTVKPEAYVIDALITNGKIIMVYNSKEIKEDPVPEQNLSGFIVCEIVGDTIKIVTQQIIHDEINADTSLYQIAKRNPGKKYILLKTTKLAVTDTISIQSL